MKENGQTEFKLADELEDTNSETKDFDFKCYYNFCFYKKLDKSIYFITKNYGLEKINFEQNSFVVDVTYKDMNQEYLDCQNCRIIDKKYLEKNGALLIYIDSNKIHIEKSINPQS